MIIRTYSSPPPEAMEVRHVVFEEEQGFVDDPDDTDSIATHLVGFENERPVAVCRVFRDSEGIFMLGRFAVIRTCRGQGLGGALLAAAEAHARQQGAHTLALHSQWHAKGFYEQHGYIPQGDIEYEQDQPHIYMQKAL